MTTLYYQYIFLFLLFFCGLQNLLKTFLHKNISPEINQSLKLFENN